MSDFYLKVLGSGDAFHSGRKLHTSFYLNSPRVKILIDCGVTTLFALKKEGISSNQIDVIIITHFHGDHFGGLPFLLLDAQKIAKRKNSLRIITPEGGQEKLKQLFDLLYPDSWEKIYTDLDLSFGTYAAGEKLKADEFRLIPFQVIHSEIAMSHAVKLEVDGKVIGYSGDTEWTPVLAEISDQADLFICECNFYEKQVQGHLNYKILSENSSLFNCKKIVLTHMGQEMLEKESVSDFEFCKDGHIFNL